MNRPLRILIVAAEVEPIATTGELGRSVSGLACALKSLGTDVRIVMPKYRGIQVSVYGLTRLVQEMRIQVVNRFGNTAIYRDELPGDVPVYLIEKDKYFDRDNIYGSLEKGYEDNAERFIFFNICALELFTQIGFYPDVIHCHDWHTGLIPVYLKTLFRYDPLYAPMKTLFTIHDLMHIGQFPSEILPLTGLPESVYHSEGVEFYGGVNFLKSGIVYADLLNTTSKQYCQEIQSSELGGGFKGLFQIRSKELYGVVNGVNYKNYNPRIDPYIAVNYSKDDISKKPLCKQDVLNLCGLPKNLNTPLIGMIAPLETQKGIDLLTQALEDMMSLDLMFIFLNKGNIRDNEYAKRLNILMAKHSSQIRFYAEYDARLEHKILAGSDILLMPSRSEPSGVMQMYGLKYGTIPFVRATGGLDDTIVDFQPECGKGNGFKFVEYTPEALLAKLQEALTIYCNNSLWDLLRANAMRVDYSWVYTARKYLNLYKLAMNRETRNRRE